MMALKCIEEVHSKRFLRECCGILGFGCNFKNQKFKLKKKD